MGVKKKPASGSAKQAASLLVLVVEEEEHFQVEVVEGQNSMEEVEEEHWHIVEGEH